MNSPKNPKDSKPSKTNQGAQTDPPEDDGPTGGGPVGSDNPSDSGGS